MIDQEKQSIYSGELSHYTVTLAMKEKQLEIKVSGNEILHKFHGFINQQFIDSQDRFFSAYFECPEDVFTHLTEHFQEIVIENGILRFHYTSGKKSQVREVVVELVKEEVDDNALAHLKIAKMKDHFTAQLKQRDGQIATLSKDLRDIREIANQFMEKIQKEQVYSKGLQERIQRLQDRLQKQENHAKALEDRLQMQERNSKDIEERLKKQEKSSKNAEEKINEIDRYLDSIPKAISHHSWCVNSSLAAQFIQMSHRQSSPRQQPSKVLRPHQLHSHLCQAGFSGRSRHQQMVQLRQQNRSTPQTAQQVRSQNSQGGRQLSGDRILHGERIGSHQQFLQG